jgi:hypothetical protein
MQSTIESPVAFEAWPKMGRLFREIVVTEKLDGTNAQVFIPEDGGPILSGSRTRWITPEDDNFGFAKWVRENEEELRNLGPGRHFGEWWGAGIQRRYGMSERRFSLFNTLRSNKDNIPACCDVVPVLYQGMFYESFVHDCLDQLKEEGSVAAPGFMNPEGVIVYHTAARIGFKYTLDGDGHKGS